MQASKVANFSFTADYDSPRILVVRKEGRKEGREEGRILKVALNFLKLRYV